MWILNCSVFVGEAEDVGDVGERFFASGFDSVHQRFEGKSTKVLLNAVPL